MENIICGKRKLFLNGGALALAAAAVGQAPMTASAQQMLRELPNSGGMTGTINNKTKEIYIFGALTDKDHVNTNIQVNILEVPPERYSITKVENNNQTVNWNVWALRLGFGVTFDPSIVRASANFFTKLKWVPERNCLVYWGGTVRPGQTLVKRWGIDYRGGGPIVVQHYERTGNSKEEVTEEMVNKGWGDKPVDAVINLKLQVIE